MKFTEKKLRQIIREETESVLSEIDRAKFLKQILVALRQRHPDMPEKKIQQIMKDYSEISSYFSEPGSIHAPPVRTTTTEALDDYSPEDAYPHMGKHAALAQYQVEDVYSDGEINMDAIQNNLQVASRILEEMPFDELPEPVIAAAQNLRDAMDELAEPALPAREPLI